MGDIFVPKRSEDDEREMMLADNPDKFCLVTDSNIQRRLIPIIDDVTEHTFEQVLNLYNAITDLDAVKPIKFLVGTRGGDTRSMLGIMNLILLSKIPCYTYLVSETYSAGAWIYLCGHRRFAPKTELVSLMLHPMNWSLVESQVGEHTAHASHATELGKKLMALVLPRTKLSKKRLKELVTTDTHFFIGEEIFKYGLATDTIENIADLFKMEVKPKTESKKKALTD